MDDGGHFSAGRLPCDAGSGWKRSDADARPDVLRKFQRYSRRWPKRKQHQAGKIPSGLAQGQGRSGTRAGQVTAETTHRAIE